MGDMQPPYLTIRSRSSGDENSMSSGDSAYASASGDFAPPSTTHDIGRVNYHVKHLDSFAKTLESSASRAFPNRGRPQQRYTKVIALLVHWKSDDLFVLPELEDLEKCMREDYGFETETFPIPSENAHLELMLRLGAMIKDHESPDTLFIVYYGGHARIDESRQSTWCATRNPNSPWLQWSAIQTLLERSASDTLILLDCCAGAASATFPNGKSITETISASSWDAIAPDPGRYSFTNALIEVLQEWRLRTFSAAMLHAEVLARLKHPRPITINGKLFEARSTPVHFMMTSNHRAPSIEIGRTIPRHQQLPSPPLDSEPELELDSGLSGGRGPIGDTVKEPTEDEPHVMISLALEDNQDLDLGAWEQWLASFPALAKYVKVQGVFKSHSTLLLLSVPVMIWDLLPEDRACSFVAFIRSNNLLKEKESAAPTPVLTPVPSTQQVPSDVVMEEANADRVEDEDVVSDEDDYEIGGDNDTVSVISGTTFTATEALEPSIRMSIAPTVVASTEDGSIHMPRPRLPRSGTVASLQSRHRPRPTADNSFPPSPSSSMHISRPAPPTSASTVSRPLHSAPRYDSNVSLSRTIIMNQQRVSRRTVYGTSDELPDGPPLAQHIVDRLEEYFQREQNPSVGISEFFASNLGVETRDIDLWFHRRRQLESTRRNLQNLTMDSSSSRDSNEDTGARMILPGHLNNLLDIFPATQLLFIDLRSPTDFDKSHIYGAVNLRVPVSFVEHSYDFVDRMFTDEQSRRNFAKGPSSRCIIFYDRVAEFAWECPLADALIEQLREKRGWHGDYYVLKGHYREFSSSFDKYITGDRMTQTAKDYADSLRQRSPPSANEIAEIEERYAEWKMQVESNNRIATADAATRQEERRQAVDQHQAELEAELEGRNPVLYHKAMGLRPEPLKLKSGQASVDDGGYPVKEPRGELVEPLSRGLEKMHAGMAYMSATTPGYDKLAEPGEFSAGPSTSDDFDEIDPRGEQLQDDPAYLKAGNQGGLGGVGRGRRGSADADARRGRERSFWKRLRTNK